ncbi:28S ribosomal protein S15, mitochondrial [Halotydeus destructor]|nr:28S ribosomal protein S15, mitochondrial [Halotydeus destructor]
MASFVLNHVHFALIRPQLACCFHTSNILSKRSAKFLAWPNDWLPFGYERPEDPIGYFETGDPEMKTAVDLDKYRKGYEFLADDDSIPSNVKKMYTLEWGSRGDRLRHIKRETVAKYQRHPVDIHSHEARIARHTVIVRGGQEQVRYNAPNDVGAKMMINYSNLKRNRLLNELSRMDSERYELVKNTLNIEHSPSEAGVGLERVERKKSLRRLTQKYCDKMKNKKLDEYKESLSEQRNNFLKEKEDTMKWVDEQMKSLDIKETDLKPKSFHSL